MLRLQSIFRLGFFLIAQSLPIGEPSTEKCYLSNLSYCHGRTVRHAAASLEIRLRGFSLSLSHVGKSTVRKAHSVPASALRHGLVASTVDCAHEQTAFFSFGRKTHSRDGWPLAGGIICAQCLPRGAPGTSSSSYLHRNRKCRRFRGTVLYQ